MVSSTERNRRTIFVLMSCMVSYLDLYSAHQTPAHYARGVDFTIGKKLQDTSHIPKSNYPECATVVNGIPEIYQALQGAYTAEAFKNCDTSKLTDIRYRAGLSNKANARAGKHAGWFAGERGSNSLQRYTILCAQKPNNPDVSHMAMILTPIPLREVQQAYRFIKMCRFCTVISWLFIFASTGDVLRLYRLHQLTYKVIALRISSSILLYGIARYSAEKRSELYDDWCVQRKLISDKTASKAMLQAAEIAAQEYYDKRKHNEGEPPLPLRGYFGMRDDEEELAIMQLPDISKIMYENGVISEDKEGYCTASPTRGGTAGKHSLGSLAEGLDEEGGVGSGVLDESRLRPTEHGNPSYGGDPFVSASSSPIINLSPSVTPALVKLSATSSHGHSKQFSRRSSGMDDSTWCTWSIVKQN